MNLLAPEEARGKEKQESEKKHEKREEKRKEKKEERKRKLEERNNFFIVLEYFDMEGVDF